MTANETHLQTKQLTALAEAFQSFLEIYKSVNPEQTLQLERLEKMRAEMRKCCPLEEKPELICVSKAELTDAATVRDALAAELGREVLLISSVTGEGLSKLVGKANELIVEQRRLEREAKERAKPVEFATEKAVRETEGEPGTQ